MRVFALGGYGTYGLPAVRLLAESDVVTEIALAGRTLERAEQAAAEIGEKARAVQVDGTDEEQLAALFEGCDIIVNIATNQAVLPGIRAAIRAGVHYCDVSHGPIAEQALQLDTEAKVAGITAILCNGIAPGITNLMGVHAASHLDEAEQLQAGRAWIFRGARVLTPQQWLEDPQESLAAIQEFKPFIAWMLRTGQETPGRMVRAYQDGQWVDVDPLRSGVGVPLPEGGTVTAYPYRTGAPVWGNLPRDLASVGPVEVWFSPFPPQLHDLLREQALRVHAGDVDAETAVSCLYEAIADDPTRWLTPPHDFVAPLLDWVTAVGRKEGRAARYNCWLTPAMWIERNALLLTGTPLVVAALWILRGEIRDRGIVTAETAFEPQPFFDEVARLLPEPPPDTRLIGESFEWLE